MFVSAASSAPSAARVTTHGMIVWNGLHRAARGENATRTVAFRDRRGRSRRRVAKRLSRDEGRSPAPPLLLRLLRARGRVRQLGRDGDATSALLRPLRSFDPGGGARRHAREPRDDDDARRARAASPARDRLDASRRRGGSCGRGSADDRTQFEFHALARSAVDYDAARLLAWERQARTNKKRTETKEKKRYDKNTRRRACSVKPVAAGTRPVPKPM